jgi:hypothetical protein
LAAKSGPFEILEVLGDGAFAAVFVARHADDPLRRLVAIKVLKAEYASNAKVLLRTRDEARLLSQLHHPNIVRVEQLLDIDEKPIIVMEFVQGLSLKRLLERQPKGLPAAVAMEVMRQTCIALHVAYTEAKGNDGQPLRVIHRDIKPSNMLLSIHGELKVVDFGIATGRFAGREAHTESVVMGSRPYMAPERLDGAADTPAVDIYSAGMSLLELLTGKVLNLSINPTSHDRALASHLDAVKPDALSPEGRDDLRRLIRRMLAYDVDYRPTAEDTATELGRLIDTIDPAYYVSLETYAAESVKPAFDSRTNEALEAALEGLQDSEMITGVFRVGAQSPSRRKAMVGRRAAMFFGTLVGVVIGLGFLAGSKALRAGQPASASSDASMVRVKVWMPSDARARIGSQSIRLPGHLDVVPGSNTLELYFDSGPTLACPFDAAEGKAVRYVVERGVGAISVDDGPAVKCTVSTDGAR